MKDKMFLFPALILVLTPCVWYSNQPGVDGIQGIDFLLSPGCFLATAIAVIGWLLRKEAVCLIGNLLFIPAMLLFVYRQGQIFEGNSYSAMTLMSGLSAWGIAVIGIAVAGCIVSAARMAKKHEKKKDKAAERVPLPFFCRGPIKFLPHSYQSNLYFPPHLLKKPSKTTVPIVEILLFTTII